MKCVHRLSFWNVVDDILTLITYLEILEKLVQCHLLIKVESVPECEFVFIILEQKPRPGCLAEKKLPCRESNTLVVRIVRVHANYVVSISNYQEPEQRKFSNQLQIYWTLKFYVIDHLYYEIICKEKC